MEVLAYTKLLAHLFEIEEIAVADATGPNFESTAKFSSSRTLQDGEC
jgi:hypothetical protein